MDKINKYVKGPKAIVFDFDGTIADSFEIFIEAMEIALKKPRDPEVIEMLRKQPTMQIAKTLGIKPWQLPFVLFRGRRAINERMERVRVFASIPEVLAKLAPDFRMYILSTNSTANIAAFLKKYHLSRYITKIYGGIGFAGKARGIKKLLASEQLRAEKCLYVGDETRDIEAAKKAGVQSVAAAWGYAHPDTLTGFNPDGLAKTPADLAPLARKLLD